MTKVGDARQTIQVTREAVAFLGGGELLGLVGYFITLLTEKADWKTKVAQVATFTALGIVGGMVFMNAQHGVRHFLHNPSLVVGASPFPPSKRDPALLADRPMVDGKPTAYVCEGFFCKKPVTDAENFRKQL